MEVSRYHKFLRVSMLVVTSALVFESGIISPVSKQVADNSLIYLADTAAGVYASVPPNELNTITASLTEKQKELDAREAALNAREIQARDFGAGTTNTNVTYILSVILFVLVVLIVLNYILDWRRARSSFAYEGKTV